MNTVYTLQLNGYNIVLPQSGDLFISKFLDDTWSTDIEIPLNPSIIKAFEIKGLLTGTPEFYSGKPLQGVLHGNGIYMPVDVHVESISQKTNILTIYVSGTGVLAQKVSDIVSQMSDTEYFDPQWQYPLYWNEENKYCTGFKIGNDFMLTCTPPTIHFNDIQYLTDQVGYHFIGDLSQLTDLQIIPNVPKFNGRYKMRKFYSESVRNGLIGNNDIQSSAVYKGDYPGLSEDKFDFNSRRVNTSVSFQIRNESKSRTFMTRTKLYYRAEDTDYENYEYNNINAVFTADVPFSVNNVSSTPFGNRYQVAIGGSFSATHLVTRDYECVFPDGYDNTLNYSIILGGYIQDPNESYSTDSVITIIQFYDDDYEGVMTPKQETTDYRESMGSNDLAIHHLTAFTSGAWGCNRIRNYHGDFPTNFNPLQDDPVYHESFYNSSVALQWTNKLDWLNDLTIKDILKAIASYYGKFLTINDREMTYSFEDEPVTGTINEHIYYDELSFDAKYTTIKLTTPNEIEYLYGQMNDEDKTDIEGITNVIEEFDMKTWNSSAPWVILDASGLAPIDTSMGINRNATTLSPVADGWELCNINDYDSTISLYDPAVYPTTEANYEPEPYTLLNVGQIVELTVIGYVPTDYVVYQTRTFRVLEQEIDENGVNNLKLILYM